MGQASIAERAAFTDRTNELYRLFKKGTRSPELVLDGLQRLVDGTWQMPDPFSVYADHLLSLPKQWALLEQFNQEYWGNIFTFSELESVDIGSHHVQRVEDLEVLFVWFGSLERTIEMWWKVISERNPEAQSDYEFDLARRLKVREHRDTLAYARGSRPTVHRVHVNLVANWDRKQPTSTRQMRASTLNKPYSLAHAEVLATYGLHAELMRLMDGRDLPYTLMAGIEDFHHGDTPYDGVPFLRWTLVPRHLKLGAKTANAESLEYAAPVVWQRQSLGPVDYSVALEPSP